MQSRLDSFKHYLVGVIPSMRYSIFEGLPANACHNEAHIFSISMNDSVCPCNAKTMFITETEFMLLEVIYALNKQLELLSNETSGNYTICSRCSSLNKTSTPASSGSDSKIKNKKDYCYYHFKFGPLARKCRKPCSWNSNGKHI